MSEEIIKVLDALGEKFGVAVNWSSKNVIPYLQQLCGKYIKYEIATSVLWTVIGFILLIFAICVFKKRKYFWENWDEELAMVLFVFVFVSFTLGVTAILYQAFDIVTCLTFPEKILIEEMQSIYQQLR